MPDPIPQPSPDPETALLLSHLDAQRDHVLGILEGLDEDALRRPVLPSGWSCLGLVRHLTVDDERFWFRRVVAAEQDLLDRPDDVVEDAWRVGADVSSAEVFGRYRQEIGRANAIITASALDTPPAWWPTDLFGTWRLHDLREVILHVITETACHAGHLDAARELIDGRAWLVLSE
ncbi:DinB family protein [Micromonospora sp. ATA51]|uniref:DinB family protein n=1 Tax=Micromonospora sp. ATA51 TaxID=2806098 RepID=UPI001A48CF04|nr:DinB family protein [Micromonospora sp. ATA51]MBM0225223.1 DinB family protein [Micromonospora sp. ATA51]